MRVCLCVFSRVYIRHEEEEECEERKLCLQPPFRVTLRMGWNSVEFISQCRFRVGCENDTGFIKTVCFKWFIFIRKCQLLEVVRRVCTVLIELFLSVPVCRIGAVPE